MRSRNENLTTGSLLTRYDADGRANNCSVMFLLSGSADIEPMHNAEKACRALTNEDGEFEWRAVVDQANLSALDPELDPSKVTRLEAAEFRGLDGSELRELLGPMIDRMKAGKSPLFPSAGAAVGAVATGINFLPRDEEIGSLRVRMKENGAVLLTGPRRTGKTSLLRRFSEDDSQTTCYLDIEQDFSLAELAARFLAQVSEETFGAVLRRAESGVDGWRDELEKGFDLFAEQGGRYLILDELVSFLENLASEQQTESDRNATFLGALDSIGRGCSEREVSILTASSIDLEDYLHEHGIDWKGVPEPFLSAARYSLPPLAMAHPEIQLRRLILGTGLVPEQDDLEWLFGNIDLTLPYPARQFLDRLASELRDGRSRSTEELDESLKEFLKDTDAFKDMTERFRRKTSRYPGSHRALRECLHKLVDGDDRKGVPRSEIEACLTGIDGVGPGALVLLLIDSYPISEREGCLILESRIFRRWWCQLHD